MHMEFVVDTQDMMQKVDALIDERIDVLQQTLAEMVRKGAIPYIAGSTIAYYWDAEANNLWYRSNGISEHLGYSKFDWRHPIELTGSVVSIILKQIDVRQNRAIGGFDPKYSPVALARVPSDMGHPIPMILLHSYSGARTPVQCMMCGEFLYGTYAADSRIKCENCSTVISYPVDAEATIWVVKETRMGAEGWRYREDHDDWVHCPQTKVGFRCFSPLV